MMEKKYIVLSLLTVYSNVYVASLEGKTTKVLPLAIRNNIQTLLTTNNGEGLDLRGADLKGKNLAGANLKKASLKMYTQMCPQKVGGDCSSWRQAANLSGADLHGANLSKTNLHEAILDRANLQDADLRGSNLTSASLKNTKLNGALLDETTTMPDGNKYSKTQLKKERDDNGLKDLLPRIKGIPNLPWLDRENDPCKGKKGTDLIKCRNTYRIG